MSYRKPYLDSSVYIAAIKAEEGRVDTARAILKDAENGRIRVCASTFIVVEVCKAPRARALTEAEEKTLADFFLHDYFEWVEVDMTVAREARSLAREHSLKPADAIHLASALRAGADCLLRWDSRFTAGADCGIRVCDPYALDRQEELELEAASPLQPSAL